MAFITTIKPDYVNPITLISCVMHEEDLTEKNPIILNSTFDGNSHTQKCPGKIFKWQEKAFAGEINETFNLLCFKILIL